MERGSIWSRYERWAESLSPLRYALLFGLVVIIVTTPFDAFLQKGSIWVAAIGNIWLAVVGAAAIYLIRRYRK